MPTELWKAGQSGNPSGRPKGAYTVKSFKQILDKIGEEKIMDDPLMSKILKRKFFAVKGITKKVGVMQVVYQEALKGKDWALRYVADYSEGKPKEFHEITKKTVTVDIDNEENKLLPEGEEIGTDEETNTTSSDNNS